MERPLKNWVFDRYTAISPGYEYELWICSGFSFFKDHRGVSLNRKPLIAELSFSERWKLWCEIKKEQRIRGKEKLKAILNHEH